MPPKARSRSMLVKRKTPSPSPIVKAAGRRPGRPAKSKDTTKEMSDGLGSSPSTSAGPSTSQTDKRAAKLTFAFPFETLDLGTVLDGTVSAAHRALTQVLDDHVVRCTIPPDQMVEICKKIKQKLANRRTHTSFSSTSPLLGETLSDVLDSTVEADIGLNKSVFRQELVKYVLIATSQVNRLSTETLLSMVEDVAGGGSSMVQWEAGYPAKVVSTCYKFFDITKQEFLSLPKAAQLMMNKAYIEEALRYNVDVEEYLNGKHVELTAVQRENMKKTETPATKASKEAAERRETELALEFRRNASMGRHMREQMAEIVAMEEESVDPVWLDFRTAMLHNKMGVRTKDEELKLERSFTSADHGMIKALLDQIARSKGEERENDAFELFVQAVPQRKVRQCRKDYIPTPYVHQHGTGF